MTYQRAVRLAANATYQDVRKIDEALVVLLMGAGGIDETTIHSIELAVHEVATNIVDHAYPAYQAGVIEASFTLSCKPKGTQRQVIVELSDIGTPFDAATVAPVNLEVPQESGYGLFLAQTLMDEVHYERRAGRNIWRLTKRV